MAWLGNKDGVASFENGSGVRRETALPGTSGSHFEELVNESILTPDATPAHPLHLALPNYIYRVITLNLDAVFLVLTRMPLFSVQFMWIE